MTRLVIKSVSAPRISRIRPIHVMCDAGVTETEMRAVIDGLTQVMNVARAPAHMSVTNFGVWRGANYIGTGGHLTEWNSVEWYIAHTKELSRKGQLHGGKLLRLLYNEPWQEASPHYDIVVTSHDIYEDDCQFCIGLAIHGFGTVISTARFRGLPQQDSYNCIVTETMHEVGHVFGLVPNTRRTNVKYSLGLHCTNRCIMRQGLNVPYDWQVITTDRLQGHEFCSECRHDLELYLHQ